MSYGVWSLVIFLTFAVGMLGIWVLLDRLTDQPDQPEEDTGLAVPEEGYGPFPVDTGPLLLLSEKAAALVGTEREVRALIVAAEEKIPVRWR